MTFHRLLSASAWSREWYADGSEPGGSFGPGVGEAEDEKERWARAAPRAAREAKDMFALFNYLALAMLACTHHAQAKS